MSPYPSAHVGARACMISGFSASRVTTNNQSHLVSGEVVFFLFVRGPQFAIGSFGWGEVQGICLQLPPS